MNYLCDNCGRTAPLTIHGKCERCDSEAVIEVAKFSEEEPPKKMDEIQGKDGEWVPVTSLLGCCDCGLIHRMEYRVVNAETGEIIQSPVSVRLEMRSVRDRELTKKARETKQFVCSIK